jgi:hypothetical protein
MDAALRGYSNLGVLYTTLDPCSFASFRILSRTWLTYLSLSPSLEKMSAIVVGIPSDPWCRGPPFSRRQPGFNHHKCIIEARQAVPWPAADRACRTPR